ncbi:MAG: N-acetyltransferase family protein [Acidimicrobiales bacterium]
MTRPSPGGAVSVRPAAADDVEAMLDVLERVVDEGRWVGTEPPLDRVDRRDRFMAAIESEAAVHLVAVVDGQVVGELGMERAPYGVAHLGMCVDPGWRGRGVGGALVAEAIAAAPRLGAHKLALQVWPHNSVARRLYRRYGFAEEGRIRRHYRRRNGELWDAVVMGLVIDQESPGSPYPDG